MLRTLLSTAAATLALAGAASVQAGGTPAAVVTTAENDVQVPADRLIGMPVLTEDGKQVGTVEDLIRDGNNRMRGVVVAVGGFFGVGAKAVGVAWNQAKIRSTPQDGEALVIIGLTSDDLDAAPAYATEVEAQATEAPVGAQMAPAPQPLD